MFDHERQHGAANQKRQTEEMTMATKNREINTTINHDNKILRIETEAGDIIIGLSNLSPAMIEHAALHGLKQKICDAAAISRDPETGRSATTETKFRAMHAVYARIMAGEWNAKRGEGTTTGGLLFRALCLLYPTKDADQIREFLAGKSKQEQAALRANPKIAAIIDEIRAESVDGVDSDELLSELE